MTLDRDELLATALRSEEEGNLAAAIVALEEVLQSDPNDARTLTWLGWLYGQREQYAAAGEILESAMALDPSAPRPSAALAHLLILQGRYLEAEVAIRRSLSLSSKSPSLVLLGVALGALGRTAQAEAAFREAIELDHGNEEAMYNLGLELRDRDPAAALTLFATAVRLDPIYADGQREYGFQLAEAHDFVAAEQALRYALALNDSDFMARLYLANVLASTDRLPEAEAELVRACELAPLEPLPLWGLAKLHEEQGRYADAEPLFRHAVELDQSDCESLFQLGRFLAARGRSSEAGAWLERALAECPSHEQAAQLRLSLPFSR